MKRSGKQWFFIVAILIFAMTYIAFFGIKNYFGDNEIVYAKSASDIRWGIDIQGGVEAAFSPVTDSDVTKAQLEAAETVIKNRLVNLGITDYETYVDTNNNQVNVQFPWKSDETEFDAASAINELGETALLTFCEGTTKDKVILSGSADIDSATAAFDQKTGDPIVQLTLTSAGKAKFAEATARLVGSSISIWMDDTQVSAPKVNEAITGGDAIISSIGSTEEAKKLASTINAGALPFKLSVDDSQLQVVSPTLGKEALNVMLIAGVIAFAVICLLMILRYRLPGVIACISLVGQVGGMIACISGFFPDFSSFTLTIPGIAGIILAIGMGVDANVITTERIREEMRKGKTITGAIETGSSGSISAIIDGNVTNVIVALVLMGAFGPANGIMAQIMNPIMFMFGASITGAIYSFGYTLLIGVILNFIFGVFASKIMLRSITSFKCMRNPWLFGGVKNA